MKIKRTRLPIKDLIKIYLISLSDTYLHLVRRTEAIICIIYAPVIDKFIRRASWAGPFALEKKESLSEDLNLYNESFQLSYLKDKLGRNSRNIFLS